MARPSPSSAAAGDAPDTPPAMRLAGGAFVLTAFALPPVLLYGNKGAVVLLVTLALLSLPLVLRGDWRRGWDMAIVGAAALLLMWGGSTVLWAELPALPLPKLGQLLALGSCGVVLLRAARALAPPFRGHVVTALVSGIAFSTAVSAIEAADGFYLTRIFRPLLTGVSWETAPMELSAFKNLASAGLVPAVAAMAAAACTRRFLAAAIALTAVIVIITITRSYTGGAALAAALVVYAAGSRFAPILTATGVAGLVSLVPFAHLLPASLPLVHALPWLPASLVHRTAIWQFAADHAWQRPWLGWGLDGSREIPGGAADILLWIMYEGRLVSYATQILPLHPHNFLLQVWLELGFVGLALFVALLAALIRAACRLGGGRSVAALATLTAAATVSAASFSLWQSWWVATLWLAAAMLIAMLPARTPSAAAP